MVRRGQSLYKNPPPPLEKAFYRPLKGEEVRRLGAPIIKSEKGLPEPPENPPSLQGGSVTTLQKNRLFPVVVDKKFHDFGIMATERLPVF